MSTGLSLGNRARISSIVLYFAMQREVLDDNDGVRQVRRLFRASETNAEDSDNAEAKHIRAAAKVFFILFECANRRVIKATVRRIRFIVDDVLRVAVGFLLVISRRQDDVSIKDPRGNHFRRKKIRCGDTIPTRTRTGTAPSRHSNRKPYNATAVAPSKRQSAY
jgi:hypothetical protein